MARISVTNNVVITCYGFITTICAGIFFWKISAFFFVGFMLAFILKLVNSIEVPVHSHGLEPATKRSNNVPGKSISTSPNPSIPRPTERLPIGNPNKGQGTDANSS